MSTAFSYILRLLLNSPTAQVVASHAFRYATRQSVAYIVRRVNASTKTMRTVH